MVARLVWRSTVASFVLTLGVVTTAQAQMSDLTWSFRAGLAVPAGTYSDYFGVGPTVGAQAEYPLQDRVDLVFSADWDQNNDHPYFGTPIMNMWRYQIGVLADLVGQRSDSWVLEGRASAGGATFRSKEDFYLEAGTTTRPTPAPSDLDAQSFGKTSVTASGGLRLRFGGDSRLNGFLGVDGYWASMGEEATEPLRLTEPSQLDALSSAMGYSINAGFIWAP